MVSVLRSRWLVAVGGLLLGCLLGYFAATAPKLPLIAAERQQDSSYRFISPLLACGEDNFSHLPDSTAEKLKKKVSTLLVEQKQRGEITDASIYFRDLNGGPTFGIESDTYFTPGSLLKVPLVLGVYKYQETDPTLAQKTFLYTDSGSTTTVHFPSEQILPAHEYTLEDLVRATLVHSDNTAALLLTEIVPKQELLEVYGHLGIRTPSESMPYTMTVKTYASFFRILYNGTYLTHEASEHMLDLLSQATFTQGLVAGVPRGTIVAHKFGEREIEGDAKVQLHDCGIVYPGTNPYLLCVMMRGTDLDILAQKIAEVSAMVFAGH